MSNTFSFQNIGTSLALVISVSALIVSIIETNILKEQQKVTVWPYLNIGATYNSDGVFLMLKNNGVGPAIIKSVEVAHQGQKVKDWEALLQIFSPNNTISYDDIRVNEFNNTVVKAGDEIRVFGVYWNEETRPLAMKFSNIDFKICYCSVAGDCWELKNKEVQKVKKAVKYPDSFED